MARLGLGKRLGFASIPLLALLLGAEACVRLSGVAESCPNRFSRDGGIWVCDPILHSQIAGNGQHADVRLERIGRNQDHGIRTAHKTPGLARINAQNQNI